MTRNVFQIVVLLATAGCGPTYMGPPTTMQPPGYPAQPRPVQPMMPQPRVPPDGATARSLTDVPDVSPNDVYLPPRSGAQANYHRLQRGESLSSLAKRFGVSVEDLRKANAWSGDPQLREGDMILIPK